MIVLALLITLQSMPADVRRGGDDGLSNRLAEATEIALANDPADDRGLVVIFQGHADWRKIDGRTEVSFVATARRYERSARIEGRCWDDELQVCAAQIVDRTHGL
jgi:hypothetical protein